MSWATVAKKDFRDAVRSRALLGLTTLFVLFAAGYSYLFRNLPQLFGTQNGNASTIALLRGMQSSASLLVPLIALVIGYKAVVGERDSGSLKLLLSLPNTRRDVVIGKLLGRTAVVAIAVIVGFAAGAIVGVVIYDTFAIVDFLLFALMTVAFAFVFVAIAVGFSAAMKSSSRALYGACGLFVLFQFIWGLIPLLIQYVANGFSFPNLTQTPDWAIFFTSLNPQAAYNRAAAALLPDIGFTSASGLPFYLQNWFAFIILGTWLIAPIGLGYYRFRKMDL